MIPSGEGTSGTNPSQQPQGAPEAPAPADAQVAAQAPVANPPAQQPVPFEGDLEEFRNAVRFHLGSFLSSLLVVQVCKNGFMSALGHLCMEIPHRQTNCLRSI